jgi:hypothetical protein
VLNTFKSIDGGSKLYIKKKQGKCKMENLPDWGWLFLAYAIGTILGWFWGIKKGAMVTIENTIDALVAQGYLKQRKNTQGEIELLKPKTFEE